MLSQQVLPVVFAYLWAAVGFETSRPAGQMLRSRRMGKNSLTRAVAGVAGLTMLATGCGGGSTVKIDSQTQPSTTCPKLFDEGKVSKYLKEWGQQGPAYKFDAASSNSGGNVGPDKNSPNPVVRCPYSPGGNSNSESTFSLEAGTGQYSGDNVVQAGKGWVSYSPPDQASSDNIPNDFKSYLKSVAEKVKAG